LESITVIKHRIQLWQVALCAGICGYLALGAATHTLKTYHWFLLALIPGAWLYGERLRGFFMDWAPMVAFWIVYDRLRLLQPLLLARVSVEPAYSIEQWLFGWMTGGVIPAHAGRAWLASLSGLPAGDLLSWSAQLIYFSHILLVPVLLLSWWVSGRYGERFAAHVKAFTTLHALAVMLYLLLPVAPPWWVSLHGMEHPTAELLAQTRMADAMDGVLVQKMIKTASLYFAAVPSLHGAYPVLLFLLALKDRGGRKLAALGLYGAAMWAATVVLNQHYIVDLLAGGLLAVAAHWFAGRPRRASTSDITGCGAQNTTRDFQSTSGHP
jgi:inositol phosphorylceramide synthase catalytic subunit